MDSSLAPVLTRELFYIFTGFLIIYSNFLFSSSFMSAYNVIFLSLILWYWIGGGGVGFIYTSCKIIICYYSLTWVFSMFRKIIFLPDSKLNLLYSCSQRQHLLEILQTVYWQVYIYFTALYPVYFRVKIHKPSFMMMILKYKPWYTIL